LLLGAAIGDDSIVSSADRQLRAQLSRSLDAADARDRGLSEGLAVRERYEDDIYPTLVAGALGGERIGVVFLGRDEESVDGLVREAIAPTGARLAFDAVVAEPLDLVALGAAAGPGRFGALALQPGLLGAFAGRVAGDLVDGGALARRVERALFSTYAGTPGPVDAVVIVRDGRQAGGAAGALAAAFDARFAAGLVASGVPVVGVELTSTEPSVVGWYGAQQLASVDDLDLVAGRTALVYALAGAHGAYGTRSSAQALLPPTFASGATGAS
jgi:hypothetical protein